MKYQVCINGRYCNPALLKNRNQQAQAQASVGIKLTSAQAQAQDILRRGGNVSAVFRNKKLPKKYGWFYGDSYETYKVFNGDKSDLRFNDPKNVIVGLYAKGRALKDNTGFVQDV